MLTAFILGLLTAVSPCPLASNITAIGFISKDIESKNRTFFLGLLYTFGRIVACSLLGALLIFMLRRGIDTFDLQSEVSRWGELLLSPILIVMGLLMLFGDKLPLARFGFSASERSERLRGHGAVCCSAFCLPWRFVPQAVCSISGCSFPCRHHLQVAMPCQPSMPWLQDCLW